MKISSRPQQDDAFSSTIGTGLHTLKVDDFQLELISALIYQCRLGQATPYSVAAFELLNLITEEFGDDWCDAAATNVDLQVTIEDDHGSVIMSTKSGNYYPTLEV